MEEDLIQFGAPPCFRDLKLLSFWNDKPASWFSLAEARFRIYGITGEQAKFDQLVGSLSKDSISRVLTLVENPLLFTPYTILKARLLDAHQLTDYQKVDSLLKMEPLGAPSELLATMLEACPHGQETNIFFTHLFLCRLPAELRIMLGEDDHQDVRNLVVNGGQAVGSPWPEVQPGCYHGPAREGAFCHRRRFFQRPRQPWWLRQ